MNTKVLRVLGIEEDTYDDYVQEQILNDSNHQSPNDLMAQAKRLLFESGYLISQHIQNNGTHSIELFDLPDEFTSPHSRSNLFKVYDEMDFESERDALFAAFEWSLEHKKT